LPFNTLSIIQNAKCQARDCKARRYAIASAAHCGLRAHWLRIAAGIPRRRRRVEALMAETRAQHERPLSPHLQVYRLTLTMMMSVVHRVTGAMLYVGTLLVASWLIAAATGPNAYATVQWFMGSLVGMLILLGYTWALIHHMLGGLRHLIWDAGYGLGPVEREWLARATAVGSVGLTVVLWLVGYLMIGGSR
jgi:succinate dehydrogenase / fumarate reductase cytochrome b subunit